MSTSVLSAAQVALPDHLFHELLAPMASCDMFELMGESAAADQIVRQLLLERLGEKCGAEPNSLVAETRDLCNGCDEKTLLAVHQTVQFITTRVRTATIAEQCAAARCKMTPPSATLILPAPRDLHGELPNRWPLTDATLIAGPGLATHLVCERPRLMTGQRPISIPPFGLPVDEIMLIRVATNWTEQFNHDERVQFSYRCALSTAKTRHTKELWLGILEDAEGCNAAHAAKEIADALVTYILSEMTLRVSGEHSLSELPHDVICILLGPCVRKFDIDVALRTALESLLSKQIAPSSPHTPMHVDESSQKTIWLQRNDGVNVTRVDMARCASNGVNVFRDMMEFAEKAQQTHRDTAALRLPCTTNEAVMAVAALLAVGSSEEAQRAAVEQWATHTPPKENLDCTFYQVLNAMDMLDASVLQEHLMHHLRCYIVNNASA